MNIYYMLYRVIFRFATQRQMSLTDTMHFKVVKSTDQYISLYF